MLNKSIFRNIKSSKSLFGTPNYFKNSCVNSLFKYCGVSPQISYSFSKNVKNNNKGKTRTQYKGSSINEMDVEDYETFLTNKKAGVFKEENLEASKNEIEVVNKKDIQIPSHCLEITYVRSQGAGGQHVNKTNSKAVIKFKLDSASFMTKEARKKFMDKNANITNKVNEAIVTCQETRESTKNYDIAIDKLKEMIADAMTKDRERVVKFAEEDPDLKKRRIDSKKARSDIKKQRQNKFDF